MHLFTSSIRLTASHGADAPINDLCLFTELRDYSDVKCQMTAAVSTWFVGFGCKSRERIRIIIIIIVIS